MNIRICAALVSAVLYSQTATVVPVEDVPGKYTIQSLPEPVWKGYANGQSIARLTIAVPGAGACRLHFDWLGLEQNAEMYLIANGAVHGPYLKHGPVNWPSFQSQWLPGSEFLIQVTGPASNEWPFAVDGLECRDAEAAASLRFQPRHTPSKGRKTGLRRFGWFQDNPVSYEEIDGKGILEGDILIGDTPNAVSSKSDNRASLYNTPKSRAWPGFRIPYAIDVVVEDAERSTVQNAVNYWNSLYPGLLVPRTFEKDYVLFTTGDGVCQAHVGHQGGVQLIKMDPACDAGNANHEVGHAIGLQHEHSRPDRDSFVRVNYSNIEDEMDFAFDILPTNTAKFGNYDFFSLMHYRSHGFSKNGKPTIEALTVLPAGKKLGSTGLATDTDRAGVSKLICEGWYTAPSAEIVEGEGATLTVNVALPAFCPWKASETANWITLQNNTGRQGAGQLIVKVAPNPIRGNRAANIVINGQPMKITQLKLD